MRVGPPPVAETAGNGGANLDDVPLFGDSGAILVAGEVRALLKETGTPQGGAAAENIGRLPNLRAAIEAMPK